MSDFRRNTKNRIRSTSPSNTVFKIIVTIMMTLFSFSFIFMFVWMISSSFRTSDSFNQNQINIFNFSGQKFSTLFDNYKQAFSFTWKTIKDRKPIEVNLFGMLGNSMMLVFLNLSMAVVFPPAVGYVMAKYDFKFKRIITLAIILSMCVPTVGSLVPTIKFINSIGLRDTWWSIILLGSGGLGMGVLLYSGYFAAIPTDYIESSRMDGANNLQTYLLIMFPQALPLVTASMVMSFIGTWNDYSTPFIYLRYNPTVATGVEYISARASLDLNQPMMFAALFIMSSFTLIIYALFSKRIMSSMSVGGVKG